MLEVDHQPELAADTLQSGLDTDESMDLVEKLAGPLLDRVTPSATAKEPVPAR